MNDRNNLILGFATAVCLSAMATLASAQQPPPPLVVKPLKGGVYWAQGGAGGNTGFIVGQNGVIVIDAKTTPESAKEMLTEIAKLTPKPVTTAILTHSDRDHVNGLAAFPKEVKVIAHENNKKEQEAALNAGGPGAPPRDYLPTQLVTKERESLKINGVSLTLIHVVRAHTSGDLAIYLPDQKIVFTGDLITANRPDVLIHAEKNGWSEGWVRFVKALVALDAETYVPGHGELQTRADVQKKLADTEQQRAKIQSLVAEGKSLADIKKALGETDRPAQPGAPQFASFTEVVYKELTTK